MSDQTTLAPELIGVVADGLERFDRAEPDAHFALPARPTVKQQLEYFSRYADTRSDPRYLRLWYSAQVLIVEWQCTLLPDFKIDLNQITDADITTLIMWVGNITLQYINDLEKLPKV